MNREKRVAITVLIMIGRKAEARQNQQNNLCAQQSLRSAWSYARSNQSLRCQNGRIPRLIKAFADCRGHYWFCRALAQIHVGYLLYFINSQEEIARIVLMTRHVIITIIMIITLFQEDNLFGMYASLTYGPQLQR